MWGLVRPAGAFTGKIGSNLESEVAPAAPGYLGLSVINGDLVEFCYENELTDSQIAAVDAVIAAHNPPTSAIEDAIAALEP